MPAVMSTQVNVRIVTPRGEQFVFGPLPSDPLLAQETSYRHGGIVAVDTDKDLAQAVGGFTLTLDGLVDADGRRWDQRIPMRSLVFVRMEREAPPGLPDVDPTVMIGLTDHQSVQEFYGEAAPRRLVQIRGRELSCVILDAMLLYHPFLADQPAYGTLTATSEAWGPLRVALTANPLLIARGDPRTVLRVLLDTYLFVGGQAPAPGPGPLVSATTPAPPSPAAGQAPGRTGTPTPQHPLINIDLPNMPLSRLLDPNYDAWRTFEDVRIATAPAFPAQVGSLWNYLHIFIDRAFQEFFTRIEDGRCRIHFRGKPFQHAYITSGTRFKSQEQDPTLETLALDPADIVTHLRQRDSSHVYNFFIVVPRGMADLRTGASYMYRIMPQVITDHLHPSFVGRYGLRVLKVESPYLSAFASAPSPGTTATPAPITPLQPQPEGAAGWADATNTYAALVGVPPADRPWFVALIHAESSFDPNAIRVNKDGSRDEGIAQFNSATRPTNVGLVDPFNPTNALPAAARYWMQLRAQVGPDPRLIAAAYNAGAGAVLAAKGIPASAEQHVRRVAALVPRYQGYAGTTVAAAGAVEVPGPGPAPSPPPPSEPGSEGDSDLIATAQRWGAILSAWYDMGGELFSGTLTVRGHAAWNIGHRLLTSDERGTWEAYIEGVHHQFDGRTGQYLTTLRYTRGWYLDEISAFQLWTEGQTTVTDTQGGPPTLDPATGVPMTRPRPAAAYLVVRPRGTEEGTP
jgi:hypothetical protein